MLDDEQIAVRLLRSPDQLPPVSDGGEHEIVGIHVFMPPASDSDDDRFAIGFQTATGRTLRLRLPGDQLAALAKVLFDLARERHQYSLSTSGERRLRGDV